MIETPSRIPWSRFVAIGDSLTEGVGDPVRGSLHGWAGRLARSLQELNPELRYYNLARRSLTTKEVYADQTQRAIALRPDLVSVIVGMNDLLARSFEADAYRSSLTDIVAAMEQTGATLVMGTFPRTLPLLRLMPPRVARATRRRLEDASDVVLSVAAEHDAVCVDAPEGWRYTMGECSVDGCHPNARGHAHIAELALAALADRADIAPPSFQYADCGLVSTSMGHIRWLASQGLLHPRVLVGQIRRAFASSG